MYVQIVPNLPTLLIIVEICEIQFCWWSTSFELDYNMKYNTYIYIYYCHYVKTISTECHAIKV